MVDGVRYDRERREVVFHGDAGLSLLQAVLTRGKFAEGLSTELLLNDWLAELLTQLSQDRASKVTPTDAPWPREFLNRVAEVVFGESWRSGWWEMDAAARRRHLQVALAPHPLRDQDLDILLELIENRLYWTRRIAAAAGNEPG